MHQQNNGVIQSRSQHEGDVNGFGAGLTDEDLTARGFVKIQAFTRAKAAATGNAARARRAREKTNEKGVSQLNVLIPTSAHPAIRAVAKELQAGESLRAALQNLLVAEVKKLDASAIVTVMSERESSVQDKVASLKGWRLWLVRLLGLI